MNKLFVLCGLLTVLSGCVRLEYLDEAPFQLVPSPSQVKWINQHYTLQNSTVIEADEEVLPLAYALAESLDHAYNLNLKVEEHKGGKPGEHVILLNIIRGDSSSNDYAMNVNSENIWLTAQSVKGMRNAIAMLKQLTEKSLLANSAIEEIEVQGMLAESHSPLELRGVSTGLRILSQADVDRFADQHMDVILTGMNAQSLEFQDLVGKCKSAIIRPYAKMDSIIDESDEFGLILDWQPLMNQDTFADTTIIIRDTTRTFGLKQNTYITKYNKGSVPFGAAYGVFTLVSISHDMVLDTLDRIIPLSAQEDVASKVRGVVFMLDSAKTQTISDDQVNMAWHGQLQPRNP